MATEKIEQQVLLEKLEQTLAEAELKTKKALESTTKKDPGRIKDLWAAAEASEFSSLIYALAFGMEDSKTITRAVEIGNSSEAIKEAFDALQKTKALLVKGRLEHTLDAYDSLRHATDTLRSAYLSTTRPGKT